MNNGFDRMPSGVLIDHRPGRRAWIVSGALIVFGSVGAWGIHSLLAPGSAHASIATPPPPSVAVSEPLQRELEAQLGFLGQFSAVERVELRAQVGGTLIEIHFKDGDIVKKGALLFVIDPVPYEIKLSEATAQLESSKARLELAARELVRAEQLKHTDAGSTENVDQRAAEKRAAEAAVANANALVRDARFDLDHCRITAPFAGRIGNHLVSTGNLIAGSRAASSPTTLLTTLVSLDPIYLDFDMSEADYMTFARGRAQQKGQTADEVQVSLSDESDFTRKGTFNFVDNALDRSSGTIHARAIVRNEDLLLTPGGFARVRLAASTPQSALLVPDEAVMADMSEHAVFTVSPDNVVMHKRVELGPLRGGLRVIRAGLMPTDRVIIDGVATAVPGSKVSPRAQAIQFASGQG
jgi:RND family efflux transporter MFP subunit